MRNTHRRLNKLEQLPQFQPPPSPLKQIQDRAMQQVSDEDLAAMKIIAADLEAGVSRTPTERELAILEAHSAALETEARRMGLRSFAEAEGNSGHRR
jgi:hypothetical protein